MNTFIFFSGKGGVGKTSMACTAALRYADEGKRTLIVTTDPASNLADVFEQPIGNQITSIRDADNLFALEIDADQATADYIDRAMASVRAAFPPPLVKVMEEQMSGPCTAEIAAFDRFVEFLEPLDTSPDGSGTFDVVIFDTAPTGHTLRLLQLPDAWYHSIEEAEQGSGQTCIGPTAAIQGAKARYERAIVTLRDSNQTLFTFVLHPEATAIKETHRALAELAKLGITNHSLIVNGVIPAEVGNDTIYAARRSMQAPHLAEIKHDFPVATRFMPLLNSEIRGVERLRYVGRLLFDGESAQPVPTTDIQVPVADYHPLDYAGVQQRLRPQQDSRLLFFAGKGGVGKTVAACMTAIWLARQGLKTLLLTTDPAAHLGDVLGVPVGNATARVQGVEHLWATRIDAKDAATRYTARLLDEARQRGRSAAAIAIMAEELESPCTEEIAAFDRFIEYATQKQWDVIVFDTAPTGHTLRLLQLPFEWSKQLDLKAHASIESNSADALAMTRFGTVIDTMRDPSRSTVAFVLYPEYTPIQEAYRASEELQSLGIETGLVVANFVIPAEGIVDSFGQARQAMQQKYLRDIRTRFRAPVVEIPLQPREVQGIAQLEALGQMVYGTPVTVPLPSVYQSNTITELQPVTATQEWLPL